HGGQHVAPGPADRAVRTDTPTGRVPPRPDSPPHKRRVRLSREGSRTRVFRSPSRVAQVAPTGRANWRSMSRFAAAGSATNSAFTGFRPADLQNARAIA